MERFVHLVAKVCPLPQSNLNTDQILPARYLKWPRSRGLGTVLFQDLRFDAEGNERADFPLNLPLWRDAKVLVAGRNFGGGSSREAAVYALYDHGFRCVIAPSFGDIFAQNAVKNGLLTAIVRRKPMLPSWRPQSPPIPGKRNDSRSGAAKHPMWQPDLQLLHRSSQPQSAP